MLQYAVVIGHDSLRTVKVFNSVEDCQRAVRAYIVANNISGIYGYGYDDEGQVFELDSEECTMIPIGHISYNGRFWPEMEDDEYIQII